VKGALGCEPLEAAETALSESGSQSGSVLLSVFQLWAIPEFDCDPDPDKWGLGSTDKSVVKIQTKWSSIPIDSRVCQTFAASRQNRGISQRIRLRAAGSDGGAGLLLVGSPRISFPDRSHCVIKRLCVKAATNSLNCTEPDFFFGTLWKTIRLSGIPG
jgi:hypothetical protein